MRQLKLYKVGLGGTDEKGEDIPNWSSVNVVAKDVKSAMGKVRLKRGEYVEAVEIVANVDLP